MIGRSTLRIACLTLALGACYPDRSVDGTTEFASVTTAFDQAASFGTITKYALPDTVLYVPRREGEEVPALTQNTILAELREQLNALGWQEVINARTTPVDVYVTAAVTSTDYIYFIYDWWGYWGWYPYWPLGWGAGYTWYYPPYWYTYSYTTGTVLVGMVNGGPVTDPRPQAVPLVWVAAVNGVLADQSTNMAIVVAGIDQAFDQSPYLRGPQ
jgi:hypothetical protein